MSLTNAVAVKVGDTVKFNYFSGSTPGAGRRVKVDKVDGSYAFEGHDLDKDEFRRFLFSHVKNLDVVKPEVASASTKITLTIPEVLKMYKLPANTSLWMVRNVVQAYHPDRRVETHNDKIVVGPEPEKDSITWEVKGDSLELTFSYGGEETTFVITKDKGVTNDGDVVDNIQGFIWELNYFIDNVESDEDD